MKLWVDDLRPPPDGYIWVKSVIEAISWIEASIRNVDRAMVSAHRGPIDRDYQSRSDCAERAERWTIELIDLDHDAGDFYKNGGDYIRILDWLEAMELSYPIRIHSMNPVGRENMRRIIRRNGWREVR